MKQKIINFLKSLNKKNVTSGVLSIIALINQILVLCGKGVLPIDNTAVESIVSIIFTLVTNCYLAYTNFNVSEGAQKVQVLLDAIKKGVVTIEEIEDFTEKYVNTKEED